MHDSIVELASKCDVVLLAQASMLSVVETLDAAVQAKIMSSPYLGVRRVLTEG